MTDEVSATNTDSHHGNICTSQSETQPSSCNDRVSVDSSGQSAYVACPECGIILRQQDFARHWRIHGTQAAQFTPTSTIPVTGISQQQAYPLPGGRKLNVTCLKCGIQVGRTNFARHWRVHCRQALQSSGTLASRRVSPYIPRAVGVTSSVTHQATPFIRSTPRDEDQTNRLCPETAVGVSTVQATALTAPVDTPQEHTNSRESTLNSQRRSPRSDEESNAG